VHHEECHENRREEVHRFLHAARIQDDEKRDHRDLGPQLVVDGGRRQERPDLIASAGDRYRDREHVVDEQRAPRNDAYAIAEKLRRDEVASAAPREVLDQIGVRGRDDGDGDRGHRGENDREMAMRSQRFVCFFGAVR